MRDKTSNEMSGSKRQELHWSALYAFAVLGILAWGASRLSAASFTLLACLTLLVVGWRRTRSAFLVSLT